MSERSLRAGVVGVGSMGQNHARVYNELSETELVGVADANASRAQSVASEYGTDAYSIASLLDQVDMVSVAVPTQYHSTIARDCITAGVDLLIEKPFVGDPAEGRDLIERATERDVILQVGHIERFNPAVRALMGMVDDLDIIGLNVERLGPPPSRAIEDTAVMDLMIHDVEIMLAIVGEPVVSVQAAGNHKGRYAESLLEFESGIVGQLSASRVTQRKIRRLTISAESCWVELDYINQSVEVHRQSSSEFVNKGDIHHRHSNVVERLSIDQTEPLKNELTSFAATVQNREDPIVTGEDGLRALELTQTIDTKVNDETAERQSSPFSYSAVD
ncbi:Gfo/Idh/MocA family protein [Halocatena pleomorpha]|uniref:Gfo/Idh/MocA family oxidoreductase n=1 Tax=Halocatena pleomorpha TaxID=1785090 RepID=A0A3P3RAN9_9EURY|nr:Gfo/Idh/MocA family oxidoreductase [Halocatena pleomorpha]RRJ30557.1 gfo/Idh/MocA family oxidoreductase [Halocatena pleomorpha]